MMRSSGGLITFYSRDNTKANGSELSSAEDYPIEEKQIKLINTETSRTDVNVYIPLEVLESYIKKNKNSITPSDLIEISIFMDLK